MPRKNAHDENVAKMMRLLKVSKEEAEKIVADDELIDKGGKCDWEVELTPEQKKAQRKARLADRTVSEKHTKHARAENPDKRNLIEVLEKTLTEIASEIEVLNAEREISFNYNGTAYKITLSAPRKAKEE
jgi:hypothetical protein